MAEIYTLQFAARRCYPLKSLTRCPASLLPADQRIFSAMYFGVLDELTLTYVNAGHEPSQLVRSRTRSIAYFPHADRTRAGAFPESEYEK